MQVHYKDRYWTLEIERKDFDGLAGEELARIKALLDQAQKERGAPEDCLLSLRKATALLAQAQRMKDRPKVTVAPAPAAKRTWLQKLFGKKLAPTTVLTPVELRGAGNIASGEKVNG
jgi:hypothetical protein